MKDKFEKFVVILDLKGVIGSGGSAVVSRHLSYSEMLLRDSSGTTTLKILTRSQNTDSRINSSISFEVFDSILEWTVGAIKFTHNNRSKISLFVAGDPWESFWIAWIFKSLFCRKSGVQVQFHGDFWNEKWQRFTWKNRIRAKTLPVVVRLCKSARFVGRTQQQIALIALPNLIQKSFIAPLPYSLGEFQFKSFDPKEHFTIGFVGRIHPDKGIDETLRLIRCIKDLQYSISVVFVGEGPLRDRVERELLDLLIDHKLRGHLSGEELEDVWRDIDIILSVAPAESFGLVPREALARGKRIIGLENSGISDLKVDLPARIGLETLPESWNCNSVKAALENLLLHQPSVQTRRTLERQSQESLKLLIRSWL